MPWGKTMDVVMLLILLGCGVTTVGLVHLCERLQVRK